MYHHVRGVLESKTPAEAVVDVGGVGYRLTIPLTTYEKLPATGGEVRLLASLVVREDVQRLFGFLTDAERSFFRLLLSVSGVGPQLALGIVSALPLAEFRAAVLAAEPARLRRVKGIGKRLSERLVVELSDRLERMPGSAPSGMGDAERDAVLALEALGHPRRAAEEAVRKLRAGDDAATDAADIVRSALRTL